MFRPNRPAAESAADLDPAADDTVAPPVGAPTLTAAPDAVPEGPATVVLTGTGFEPGSTVATLPCDAAVDPAAVAVSGGDPAEGCDAAAMELHEVDAAGGFAAERSFDAAGDVLWLAIDGDRYAYALVAVSPSSSEPEADTAVEVPFEHAVEPPDSTIPAEATGDPEQATVSTTVPAVSDEPEPVVPTTTTEPAPEPAPEPEPEPVVPTTTTTKAAPEPEPQPEPDPPPATTAPEPEPSHLPPLTGRSVALVEDTDAQYENPAGGITRRSVPLRLGVGDAFFYPDAPGWVLLLSELVDRFDYVRCSGGHVFRRYPGEVVIHDSSGEQVDCELTQDFGDRWQLYACTRESRGSHVFTAWRDSDGRFRVELDNSGYNPDRC